MSIRPIAALATRIKPVVRFQRYFLLLVRTPTGHPYFIRPVDLFRTAYTWSPKPTQRAKGLRPIRDIRTYHTYEHYMLFKPSVAEVLAQIPEEDLDRVVAFEIVAHPETADDLNRELEAWQAGYHVATTRLYARAA